MSEYMRIVPEKSFYHTTTEYDKVLICKLCGCLVYLENQYTHLDFHRVVYYRTKEKEGSTK